MLCELGLTIWVNFQSPKCNDSVFDALIWVAAPLLCPLSPSASVNKSLPSEEVVGGAVGKKSNCSTLTLDRRDNVLAPACLQPMHGKAQRHSFSVVQLDPIIGRCFIGCEGTPLKWPNSWTLLPKHSWFRPFPWPLAVRDWVVLTAGKRWKEVGYYKIFSFVLMKASLK